MRILPLLPTLLLTSSLSAAEEPCARANTQTQIDECSGRAAERAQTKMDGLLTKLRRSLTSENWRLLENSQREWLEVRRLDCEIERSFFDGGSSQPGIVNACYEAHTKDRLQQIRHYLCQDYSVTGKCAAAAEFE